MLCIDICIKVISIESYFTEGCISYDCDLQNKLCPPTNTQRLSRINIGMVYDDNVNKGITRERKVLTLFHKVGSVFVPTELLAALL